MNTQHERARGGGIMLMQILFFAWALWNALADGGAVWIVCSAVSGVSVGFSLAMIVVTWQNLSGIDEVRELTDELLRARREAYDELAARRRMAGMN